ncbi:MAG: hypothetical protein ICV60_02950 [Pyrinomonadaceae bacterium]|nr:hypothetical protein [Pyrinomonadaceae bacterium]
MGVIGRLDDQVNEVIIKPVGARRERPASEPQQRPATETARQLVEESAQDKESTKARPSEIPIWLL